MCVQSYTQSNMSTTYTNTQTVTITTVGAETKTQLLSGRESVLLTRDLTSLTNEFIILFIVLFFFSVQALKTH